MSVASSSASIGSSTAKSTATSAAAVASSPSVAPAALAPRRPIVCRLKLFADQLQSIPPQQTQQPTPGTSAQAAEPSGQRLVLHDVCLLHCDIENVSQHDVHILDMKLELPLTSFCIHNTTNAAPAPNDSSNPSDNSMFPLVLPPNARFTETLYFSPTQVGRTESGHVLIEYQPQPIKEEATQAHNSTAAATATSESIASQKKSLPPFIVIQLPIACEIITPQRMQQNQSAQLTLNIRNQTSSMQALQINVANESGATSNSAASQSRLLLSGDKSSRITVMPHSATTLHWQCVATESGSLPAPRLTVRNQSKQIVFETPENQQIWIEPVAKQQQQQHSQQQHSQQPLLAT